MENNKFTVIFCRHCESCANIISNKAAIASSLSFKKTKFIQKYWKQSLCTNNGIKQCVDGGMHLKHILEACKLPLDIPMGGSILPRALLTAALTSYSLNVFVDSLKKGGSKKKRNIPLNPTEIFRTLYIKENLNYIDPKKSFIKSGIGQSSNLSSVEFSDSYALAINNVLKNIKHDTIKPSKISLNPRFLEDIINGDEIKKDRDTIKDVKKRRESLIKSSYKKFELDVLPSIIEYWKNKGFDGVVLFVHGGFSRDAMNRSGDEPLHKNIKKKRLTKKNTDNVSFHKIEYKMVPDKNGKPQKNSKHKQLYQSFSRECNLQNNISIDNDAFLKIRPTILSSLDPLINDVMGKCQYEFDKEKEDVKTINQRSLDELISISKKEGGKRKKKKHKRTKSKQKRKKKKHKRTKRKYIKKHSKHYTRKKH